MIGLSPNQAVQAASDEWYKCVQHLGTGGNAVTYLVLSTSGKNKGSFFALKIFQRVTDADRLQKFYGEISFLEECEHPSIMRVYDSGAIHAQGNDYPFVVMEYLPSHLHDEIRRNQMDMPAKVSIATQLLSALSYLNSLSSKIVHRDIKPQNIFIKGKTCVLGDFGLMKVIAENEAPEEKDADRADMSSYIGMPFYYRTPDLVSYTKNEIDLSTKSDIFQLGLVLTELFTGRNPCKAPRHKLEPVELDEMGRIPGDFSRRIERILNKMLKPDPAERESVDRLLDHWSGVFQNISNLAHSLNGRVL